MENIIYNELKYRGFNVDVGIVKKREKNDKNEMINKTYEVDFIANLGNRRYYIQVGYSLTTIEKVIQEKTSLINIKDSFKKIIIVKDIINITRDEYGITMMSIYDFLLNENSLDL